MLGERKHQCIKEIVRERVCSAVPPVVRAYEENVFDMMIINFVRVNRLH